FDHMRVPLDVGPLMTGSDQERRDILAELSAVIAEINRDGLTVLVTLFQPPLHHELPETYLDGLEGAKFRTYATEVEQVAKTLAAIPAGQVALAPMNEAAVELRVVVVTAL